MNSSDSQLAKLVRDNFIAKVSYLAEHTERISLMISEDYIRVDCGLPSDTFNITVLLKQQLQPSETDIIEGAVHYFTNKNFPMALWAWEDNCSETFHTLRVTGLVEAETNIAMYADLDRLHPEYKQPSEFSIKEVASPKEMELFGDVLASLFEGSEEAVHVRAYYKQLALFYPSNDSAMKLYIGRIANEVVSVGSLMFTKASVGIYDIATRREFRRKSFGSAMFHYLIAEARKQPVHTCVLQASPDGIHIYKRAGFKPICIVKVYENRQLLE